jgi:membrane-bound lytic murein transglycosylase D
MTLKNKLASLLIAFSTIVVAQDAATTDTIIKKEIKVSFLDSIKATFVHDELATCIDSLWMKDLTSLDTYDDMLLDIKNIDTDKSVDFELPTEVLKERLKRMDEKSPFHIEYNIGLENTIKSFLKNRKKGFERLMGISQYYFPLFEEELAKNNIPLEIKYLAVIESALNPKATSRVGATGLWQFMYQTGKQYGLKIDSYEDERSNPLKSSQAASQYMLNMYKIFGDWDLVLASYNSGPGNVAKAIRRSGGQQNFWNIKKYLPRETQGYLPAFLATMYIFEYHKEHGIVPNKAIANRFATDTIAIKRHLTFKQISDLFDISVAEIQFFNPSYKRNEIPYITGEMNFLTLPKDKIAAFTSNEDKVYAYAKYQESLREKPFVQQAIVKSNEPITNDNGAIVSKTNFYKVRKGDNLTQIASKYNVAIDDLKKWNGLKSNYAPLGRNLKIYSFEKVDKPIETESAVVVVDSTKKEVPDVVAKVEKQTKEDKKFYSEKVITYKDVTKYHKVIKGDNLTEIASKYDVSLNDIKKWNNLKNNNVNLGANLKIVKNEKVISTIKKELTPTITPSKEEVAVVDKTNNKTVEPATIVDNTEKIEGYYIVKKGETLFSIARTNGVTAQQIKDWNRLIDNNVKVGTQLIISNQPLTSTEQEVAQGETKNIEYIVPKGEFMGAIARKFNTTVNDILEWNNLSDTNVKVGDKLIVGKEATTKEVVKKTTSTNNAIVKNERLKSYSVKAGDTLYSISKQFPGVTIADIQKWNDIKDGIIKPGMKLKIGG